MADPPSLLPPSATEETKSEFIGITDPNYRARGRASVNDRSAMEAEARGVYNAQVAPYYKNGQERTLLAGKAPEDLAAIQRMMADAGLLTGTNWRFGNLDDTTVAAFKQVLSYANGAGLTAQEALTTMRRNAIQMPQPQLDESTRRAPMVTQVTDPADLRRQFRATVQSLIGRVDEDYVDSLVSAYQQREVGAQQQVYGLTDPNGAGGSYTAPPTAAGYAEERTRQDFGTEVKAADLANTFGDFQKMLGGISG